MLVIQLKKTDYNTKFNEVEKKNTDHGRSNKNVTEKEFHKLMSQIFAARLTQGDLASKHYIPHFVKNIDFDDKL